VGERDADRFAKLPQGFVDRQVPGEVAGLVRGDERELRLALQQHRPHRDAHEIGRGRRRRAVLAEHELHEVALGDRKLEQFGESGDGLFLHGLLV
jgi:hypothetical protein